VQGSASSQAAGLPASHSAGRVVVVAVVGTAVDVVVVVVLVVGGTAPSSKAPATESDEVDAGRSVASQRAVP
jgi:hypothetical protein